MPSCMIVLARNIVADGLGPYQSKVGGCIAAYGGRYLAKRIPAHVLEGDFSYQRITVFAFDTMVDIQRFWQSKEYQEQIKPLRDELGHLDVWAVPGVEEIEQEVST